MNIAIAVVLYIMVGAQVAVMTDKNLENSWMFGVMWPLVLGTALFWGAVILISLPVVKANRALQE